MLLLAFKIFIDFQLFIINKCDNLHTTNTQDVVLRKNM